MNYRQRSALTQNSPLPTAQKYGRKEPVPALRRRRIKTWARLSRYDHVEVFQKGELVAAGLVDDLTHSGDTIWIRQDNGLGRVLLHTSDAVDIFKSSRAEATRP